MLENGGQDHKGITPCPVENEFGTSHTILGSSVKEFFPCKTALSSLDKGDLKSSISIIALFQGGIISCKLELMLPCQLKHHRLFVVGGVKVWNQGQEGWEKEKEENKT